MLNVKAIENTDTHTREREREYMQHIGKVLLLHYTMDREVYSQSNFISGRGTQANSTAPYQPTPTIKPAFVPFRGNFEQLFMLCSKWGRNILYMFFHLSALIQRKIRTSGNRVVMYNNWVMRTHAHSTLLDHADFLGPKSTKTSRLKEYLIQTWKKKNEHIVHLHQEHVLQQQNYFFVWVW